MGTNFEPFKFHIVTAGVLVLAAVAGRASTAANFSLSSHATPVCDEWSLACMESIPLASFSCLWKCGWL